MPLTGPEPKENAARRNQPTHTWHEVPNQPYTRTPPVAPPATRAVLVDGEMKRLKLTTMTRAWWRTVSTMPHCRLWSESDWLFAAETALIADDFYRGFTKAATELRQRERILGTTADARMALRIRYVDQSPTGGDQEATSAGGATNRRDQTVARLDDRRRRLTADAP
ncbi:phage terminase small subunit [Streptomonospora litoralis]|uniref:Uncharacterized protein n=1 Tax=Streptomonospora litoralis TaxID=2498135 RepID=A0A4P6PZ26_9ACTN|nr:hypothetical protein [Streptomonospora litoralis]QBI53435.1 hypothetical protein EKD16_08205 [Streptomonospora litoralis]